MKGLQIALGFLLFWGSVGVLVTGVDALRERQPAAKNLVMVTGGSGPYWRLAAAGAQAAARSAGVQLTIEMPHADGDIDDQRAILRRLEKSDVDGIALCPLMPEAQGAAIDGLSRAARVVTFVDDAVDSERICYVGVGHYAAGRVAAGTVTSAVPAGGKIVILLSRFADVEMQDRLQGLEDALQNLNSSDSAKPPRPWEVVELIEDHADAHQSVAQLRDALAEHPDLAAVVCLREGSLSLLTRFLSEAGKSDQVQLITFDQSEETLEAIAGGRVHAAIAQDPYQIGYSAVAWLARFCRSDANGLPARGQGVVCVRATVVRSDNVDRFRSHLSAPADLPTS
jgi:ribose transport system substrate-binding protein